VMFMPVGARPPGAAAADRAGLVCDQSRAAEQQRVKARCSACDEAADALVDNGGQARPPTIPEGMLWTIR
jgi:hypothetical protein